MNKITSYKRYNSNIEIFTDCGSVSIDIQGGDWGDCTWTDEEAESSARELLRGKGIDDTTADNYLISAIADQFPRAK